ncbi:MAG TPA: hypothetical protein VJ160_00315 [Anaerolineales bacterium]|nr:hypothetical protein [Anaerolineales bacterium]
MSPNEAVRAVLERHLQSILDNDVAAYHATTVPELTLYEWYVTPHRIDGLAFHDFMLAEAARPDTPATALDPAGRAGTVDKARQRFDLANYNEQVHGDSAVCSYTLLVTRGTAEGVAVRNHNESRVLVRFGDAWKVVHVHKSPAWKAPYEAAA